MRNIVDARDFNAAVSRVKKGLAKKTDCKILEQIKVEFRDGECALSSCNFGQHVISKIRAYGKDNFSFVFTNTASVIKAGKYFKDDLTFTLDNGIVTLSSNNKTLKQQTIDAVDFPEIPRIQITDTYNYDADTVNYNLVSNVSPITIRHENDLAMVLPVRI